MAKKSKRAARRGAPKRKPQEKYETLHDLLILKLRSLHDIEREIVKALPKMAKAATDEKLREAFAAHLEESRAQVERLEDALRILNAPVGKSRVEAIRGLVADTDWVVKSVKNPQARDAILIAAAQYVEHYEIAGYGTARAWSDLMDHREVSELLQETLDEESAANEKLTKLAESVINTRVESGMTSND